LLKEVEDIQEPRIELCDSIGNTFKVVREGE
jgi:hypothetical protein